MDPFYKELLDKMPTWFFQVAGGLLLLGIAVSIYYAVFGASRLSKVFSSILKRDEKIDDLHEQLNSKNEVTQELYDISMQYTTAIANLRSLIESLNILRYDEEQDIRSKIADLNGLLQRSLDTLASDIKSKAGGIHRCGLWMKEQEHLRLMITSSGFPKNYAGNRYLHIDRSVAGRCLRKRQPINLDDVTQDGDWEVNQDSRSAYRSLFCFPISDWAVLTVDGLQPMSDTAFLLCELFATLIEGVLNEHVLCVTMLGNFSDIQASATSE